MTIARRGSATGAFAFTANTTTVNKPTGVVAGDVLILVAANFATAFDTATINTPSGFTLVSSVSVGPVTQSGTTRYIIQSMFVRVADGSEGSSFTTTGTTTGHPDGMASMMCAYSGVDNTTPVSSHTGNSGSGSPVTATGLTSVPANAALVAGVVCWEIDRGPLSTLSEQIDSGGNGPTYDDLLGFAGGSTGNLTATASATESWTVNFAALNPAAGTSLPDCEPWAEYPSLTPQRTPNRQQEGSAPVGALIAVSALSPLGWLVIPTRQTSAPAPRVETSAPIGTGTFSLPKRGWDSPEVAGARSRAAPLPAVVQPVGTLIPALSSLGWLVVDAPVGARAPRAQVVTIADSAGPSNPPLMSWLDQPVEFTRAAPRPLRVETVRPVGALIPTTLVSIGWLTCELPPRSVLVAPRAPAPAFPADQPLKPFVSLSMGWFSATLPFDAPLIARTVSEIAPVGALLAASLTSLGWLGVDARAPVLPRRAPEQPQAPTSPLTPFVSPSTGWLRADLPFDVPLVPKLVSEIAPVGTLLTLQPAGWNTTSDLPRAPAATQRVDPVAPVGALLSITLPTNGWLATDNPRTAYRTQPAVVVDPVGSLLVAPALPSFGWFQTDNPRTPYAAQRAVVVDPVGTAFPFLPKFGPYWFADAGPRAASLPSRPLPSEPVGARLAQLTSVGWLSTLDTRPAAQRASRPDPSQAIAPIQFGGVPWATVTSQPARVVTRGVEPVQPIGPLVPFVSASTGWLSVEARAPKLASQRVEVAAPVGSPLLAVLTSLGWLVVDAPPARVRLAQVEAVAPVGSGFFPQVSSSLGWMLVDAGVRSFPPPRVFASEVVGDRITAPATSAAPWATTPGFSPALAARRVYSVEPVGAFIPPPVFTSIAWMQVDIARSPDVRRAAVVVDPVGSRLPPPAPLLPATAQFTAHVRPDEYIAYVRFDSLEIRRR